MSYFSYNRLREYVVMPSCYSNVKITLFSAVCSYSPSSAIMWIGRRHWNEWTCGMATRFQYACCCCKDRKVCHVKWLFKYLILDHRSQLSLFYGHDLFMIYHSVIQPCATVYSLIFLWYKCSETSVENCVLLQILVVYMTWPALFLNYF